MRTFRLLAISWAVVFVTPGPALAHLVTSGLGPFYDGSLHLLLSPGDLLGLIAMTLLAGLNGPKAGRLTVIVLPVSWLVFGVLGLNMPVRVELSWLGALLLIVLGAGVALDRKLPPGRITVVAGLYGGVLGISNGRAIAVAGGDVVSILGLAVTSLLIALLGSAMIVSLRGAWARVAVRVAGSWVAAVGMLMLGWLVRQAS